MSRKRLRNLRCVSVLEVFIQSSRSRPTNDSTAAAIGTNDTFEIPAALAKLK